MLFFQGVVALVELSEVVVSSYYSFFQTPQILIYGGIVLQLKIFKNKLIYYGIKLFFRNN